MHGRAFVSMRRWLLGDMFALSVTGSVACCSDARKEGRQQSALPCKLKTPKQTAYKVPSKTKDTPAIAELLLRATGQQYKQHQLGVTHLVSHWACVGSLYQTHYAQGCKTDSSI